MREPFYVSFGDIEEILGRLRGGGNGPRDAVTELSRRTALKLGSSPERWIHWLELGRWLREPSRTQKPPRASRAYHGPMSPLEEQLFFGIWADHMVRVPPAQLVATADNWVANRPDDGRCWLALGRVLELLDDGPRARQAYRTALMRLGSLRMRPAPAFLWGALARALVLVEGERAIPRWFAWLDRGMDGQRVWQGAKLAFFPGEAETYERFLRAGLNHGDSQAAVAIALSEYEVWKARVPEAASGRHPTGVRH